MMFLLIERVLEITPLSVAIVLVTIDRLWDKLEILLLVLGGLSNLSRLTLPKGFCVQTVLFNPLSTS